MGRHRGSGKAAANEAKRLKQKFLRVGRLQIVDNQTLEFQIKTPKPIVAFHFIMRYTITIGDGAGLIEDAIKRILRQIRLTFGGTPIQTIGDGSAANSAGQLLEPVVRGWLQAVPHDDAFALANGTFGINTIMPVAVPPNRYTPRAVNRSALRIGRASSWFIEADFGDLNDLMTAPGTAAITAATFEVIAEVDETLSPGIPEGAFIMYSNVQRQAIPAAIAVQEENQLSTNGVVLFAGYIARNAGIRNQTIITALQFRLDGSMIVLNGSFDLFQWLLEFLGDAAANAPTGLAAGFFDPGFNLNGIPAAGSTGWDILIDHLAGAQAAGDGLVGQYFYVRPRGQ